MKEKVLVPVFPLFNATYFKVAFAIITYSA